jgi:hypothetical protein
VSTSVVKMRAALPATLRPHDITLSMPALPRRQLSTICGSRLPRAMVIMVDACSVDSTPRGQAGDSSHAEAAASAPNSAATAQAGAALNLKMRAMRATSCTQHATTSPNVLNA